MTLAVYLFDVGCRLKPVSALVSMLYDCFLLRFFASTNLVLPLADLFILYWRLLLQIDNVQYGICVVIYLNL